MNSTQKQLQTNVFLRFAAASTHRPRGDRGPGKADGDFRTGHHQASTRHAQDSRQSSWYGRFCRASAVQRPVSFRLSKKEGGTKYSINSEGSKTSQVASVSSGTPSVAPSVTPSVTPSAPPVTPVTPTACAEFSGSDFRIESQALDILQQTPVGGRLRFFWR